MQVSGRLLCAQLKHGGLCQAMRNQQIQQAICNLPPTAQKRLWNTQTSWSSTAVPEQDESCIPNPAELQLSKHRLSFYLLLVLP